MFATESRAQIIACVTQYRLKNVVLVLEDLFDPHNLAATFRSADTFGFQRLMLIFDRQRRINPRSKALQKTSGHANLWLDFDIFTDCGEAIQNLKSEGFTLFGTTLGKPSQSIWETDFTVAEKVAIVVGNEHQGLSDEMTDALDHNVLVPMSGFAESLNVSVATALLVSEVFRQRSLDERFLLSTKEQEAMQHHLVMKRLKKRRKQKGDSSPKM